jgi:hypothetical protein
LCAEHAPVVIKIHREGPQQGPGNLGRTPKVPPANGGDVVPASCGSSGANKVRRASPRLPMHESGGLRCVWGQGPTRPSASSPVADARESLKRRMTWLMATTIAYPQRIISGGQTGADRGGLDAAIELGLEQGGFCPKGRLAEDGTVPERYEVRETESPDYADRMRRNAAEADGTVVFTTADRGQQADLRARAHLEQTRPAHRAAGGVRDPEQCGGSDAALAHPAPHPDSQRRRFERVARRRTSAIGSRPSGSSSDTTACPGEEGPCVASSGRREQPL